MPCDRMRHAVSDAKGVPNDDGHSEIRECSDKVLWDGDHKGGCDTEARNRSSGRFMVPLVVTSGSLSNRMSRPASLTLLLLLRVAHSDI